MPLKTYNGYEFRYIDSFIDGETGYINVEDIGTVDWSEVVEVGLKALVPTMVGSLVPVAGTTLSVAITVSDLISPLSVRPNITYSYSAMYYIKYNAMFRHYMRSFYISDEDDLIPGFDYFIAGTAEKAEIDNHISARWPTNTSWDSDSGQVGTRHIITTSGFYGANSFLSDLIDYYSLQRNYYENIQLDQALIDIMLNSN